MGFLEVEFPRALGFGSRGGRGWHTTAPDGFSGWRQYNRDWAYPLAEWVITIRSQQNTDSPTLTDYDLFYSFFQNVYGMGDGFRFYAPGDHIGTNELVAVADGSTATYQLMKNYTIAGRSLAIPIKKPITSAIVNYQGIPLSDTVAVRVAGTPTSVSVDETTGMMTFASNPTGEIRADFEFHFPVHFGEDKWNGTVEQSWVSGKKAIFNVASMKIDEVRVQ